MTKRQQRRAAAAARQATDARPAQDGFQNLQARLGASSGNLQDASGYTLSNPITRQPRQLEFMYRGSWIVGAAVDAVADDMTREGVDYNSTIPPDVIETLHGVTNDLMLWDALGDTIRWGRLYGGAIGVMLIDGQETSTELRTETITQGAFRGILPISRWELVPVINDFVEELGPSLGKPKSYTVGPGASALIGKKIHHSRVVRMEGVRLPHFQRIAEQGWGLSIIERMYDRLLAFDSSTTGAAQLVFKAYLRTLKIDGLRNILAAGGPAEETLAKQVEAIRRFQSTEGLTLIDATDELEYNAYTFTGLDDILLQFGQQLSGATEIPLVRLFGQSPAGLNATGEGDIRNYYDGIKAKQNRHLKAPLNRVLDVLYRSATGDKPPEGFGFTFNPLWQLSEKEKAEITQAVTTSVVGAYDSAIISKATALKELKQSSDVTGVFSNITDEDVTEAENEPPVPGEGGDVNLTELMGGKPAETPDPEAEPAEEPAEAA